MLSVQQHQESGQHHGHCARPALAWAAEGMEMKVGDDKLTQGRFESPFGSGRSIRSTFPFVIQPARSSRDILVCRCVGAGSCGEGALCGLAKRSSTRCTSCSGNKAFFFFFFSFP